MVIAAQRYVSLSARLVLLRWSSAAPAVARAALQPRGLELPLEELPLPQVLGLGHPLEFSVATADGKYKVIERIELSKPSVGSSR